MADEPKATEAQVRHALGLLRRAGYPTGNMDATFSKLGATGRDCLGRVEPWLRSKDRAAISELIDRLRGCV